MAKVSALSGICLLGLISFSSHAIIIMPDTDNSTENLGSFEANFTWNTDTLNLSLTNTSPGANGGFLTGFLLNLPGNVSFTGATTDSSLSPLLPSSGPYSGSPYGSLNYGYALGGNFLGGGKPSLGIGVGETASFTFSDWTGLPDGFELWSSEDMEYFLLDNTTTSRLGDSHFLARFRGFGDGGSDKVPGLLGSDDDLPPGDTPNDDTPPPPAAEVPEPSTILLWLTGLVGLFVHRRRKTK